MCGAQCTDNAGQDFGQADMRSWVTGWSAVSHFSGALLNEQKGGSDCTV